MDSIRSTRRVDALHHAAQLLQASLCDADGVLLLDGDEEPGRHGRVLLRVREQVPLRPRRPQKRHDCCARAGVGGWKNPPSKTTKTAAPRKRAFLEGDDEATTTAIIDRAPDARVSNRHAIFTVLARDALPHGCRASAGLRAGRCRCSGAARDELGCPRRSPGENLPSQGRPARFLPRVDEHHRARREGTSPRESCARP